VVIRSEDDILNTNSEETASVNFNDSVVLMVDLDSSGHSIQVKKITNHDYCIRVNIGFLVSGEACPALTVITNP